MTELATQPFWMGETFWIVLAIVVGLVTVAFIYRRSMKGMKVKGGRITAEFSTHESPTLDITGIRQKGRKNKIRTERTDTNLRDITQEGEQHIIDIKNPK